MTTSTPPEKYRTVEEWAGSQYVSLALVFTDIVRSTELGIKLGDIVWIRDLFEHFTMGREIASSFDSYVVKVIGDALMVAFKTASDAVSFAINFEENTGVDFIGIRVGINSGEMEIRENDIYGLNVNFTSRVQQVLPGEGILVTNSVKRDYEKRFGQTDAIKFVPREVDLKSFGKETVFFVNTPALKSARLKHWRSRRVLIGE